VTGENLYHISRDKSSWLTLKLEVLLSCSTITTAVKSGPNISISQQQQQCQFIWCSQKSRL